MFLLLTIKRRGHGTLANDRPPIIHIISRDTGEERCWLVSNATGETSKGIIAEAVPVDATIVYSDENRSYHSMGRRMRLSTTLNTSGQGMMTMMACAKCIATV